MLRGECAAFIPHGEWSSANLGCPSLGGCAAVVLVRYSAYRVWGWLSVKQMGYTGLLWHLAKAFLLPHHLNDGKWREMTGNREDFSFLLLSCLACCYEIVWKLFLLHFSYSWVVVPRIYPERTYASGFAFLCCLSTTPNSVSFWFVTGAPQFRNNAK